MTTLPSTAYVRFAIDRAPEVDATIRLSGTSHIYCHTYDDSAPVISVDDPAVHVAIGVPDPDRVTGQDVTNARKLAQVVARYVAELEQLAAASNADPGQDAAGRAA
jgi:hypothetical protein